MNKAKNEPDFAEWVRRVTYASRKARNGAVLAVYDGDAKTFPAGATSAFCAASAAKALAAAAGPTGAGKIFSLAIVFACVEFESWIIAGAESLAGKSIEEGRLALPSNIQFPEGDPESHGKNWLEKHCPNYRPTRDQGPLTELLDLSTVRAKALRSFRRLDRAVDQLIAAVSSGSHISSPC